MEDVYKRQLPDASERHNLRSIKLTITQTLIILINYDTPDVRVFYKVAHQLVRLCLLYTSRCV